MEFKISSANQEHLQLELLLDIFANQAILMELKAAELAEKDNIPLERVLKDFRAQYAKIRSGIVEEIYSKYGETPDTIKDILAPDSDRNPSSL